MIIIFAIMNSVIIPVEFAFYLKEFKNSGFHLFEYTIEFAFLIDILLMFITSF